MTTTTVTPELQEKLANIRLCVFDMAGTTINENNLVYKTVLQAIQQVLQQNNINATLDLDTCLELGAGKEKSQAIKDILTKVLDDKSQIEPFTQQAFGIFKATLATAYTPDTVAAFNGMENLFKQLKNQNKYVVLNTGYDRKTAEKILSILDWQVGKQIDALITADDVTNGRPAPDMIQMAMRQFDIADPSQVLKAGDSGIDILEGKNANCGLTIGVLTGAQTQEQLQAYDPDLILTALVDMV